MLGRLRKAFGVLLAALAVAAPAAAAGPAPHRIVAVGDLHGDFLAWRAIAQDAGLIDAQGRWAGGDTVLVQTGDVVDRGPDSLKILQDLIRLQREAPKAKGRVVTLVGNHEAMNMTGDLRYVSAGEYASYVDAKSEGRREATFVRNKPAIEAAYRSHDPAMTPEAIRQAWFAAKPLGALERQVAWAPDGRIGKWVVANPAVVMIDGTIFVHGGISPAYAKRPPDEVNREVATALKAQSTAPDSILDDPQGPLWYRGLAGRDAGDPATPPPADAAAPAPPSVEAQLDEVLAAWGARRMVIGHTPILSGIAVQYGGRLVRIDTGISAVYGGKVSYLEIRDGTLVPHDVARPAQDKAGVK